MARKCDMILVFFIVFLCVPLHLSSSVNDKSVEPAWQVINRFSGKKLDNVKLKLVESSNGKDYFSIKASNGVLEIEGTSQVTLCYAFRRYMQEACCSMRTWSGANMTLPDIWPDYDLPLQCSPYSLRYFLNVCTYGYTAPFWGWERWEQEIDWMALHGVNFPLATVAAEAIAERVWLRLGLDKKDIQSFFTGPAYLPWHRMGNLNTWGKGLTDDWQKQQIAMQHKILKRMRELGMHPIAPAFAGFVPMAFVQEHPEIKFNRLKWGGFDDIYNAYVLPPDSPFFVKIGKMFVEEWEKEFGENKYYLSDSFNEMDVPLEKNDLREKCELLAHYGETIYESIAAGNPDAVWVTQGWTFGYQNSFWDQTSLSALLSRIPDDKMIIIDLGNEFPKWVWKTDQTWKRHDGFYGKKWIFSYVPNFGGKNLPTGDLAMYASASIEALHAQCGKNLVGFGSAPEGLENNEVIYELLSDVGWSDVAINLDTWLYRYCRARYGKCPDNIYQAWMLLKKSTYSSFYAYPRFTWQTVVPDTIRHTKVALGQDFFKAVELFLSNSDSLQQSELYRNDAIEFAAYYLSAKADILYKEALDMKQKGYEANAVLSKAISLLLDVDRLLLSHPLYRLDRWVTDARLCGKSVSEQDCYEMNAKRLITTWGGKQEDYAARVWSGLIKDYYIPRLQCYFDGKNLDVWEEQWITTPWQNTTEPFEHPLKTAVRLVNAAKEI